MPQDAVNRILRKMQGRETRATSPAQIANSPDHHLALAVSDLPKPLPTAIASFLAYGKDVRPEQWALLVMQIVQELGQICAGVRKEACCHSQA